MTDKPVATTHVVRVIDPDNVREVFITGGTNVVRMGNYVQIIHTVMRHNTEALFANRPHAPDLVVVARLIMESGTARELADSILIQLGEARTGGAAPDLTKAN